MSEAKMFCFQCEQTAKGKGCTRFGVCGKNPEVAALQDLLIYTLKSLSQVALKARGPSLPAFITPNVVSILVKNFNLMPITSPKKDLKAILG